mmetsp:Transcript_7559/g.13979  ORF Transcript_7559/g.13979 Transcript_7559/m.13979 type:complete len:570 (+) Transcript_7559:56-1765(+)
MAQPSLSTVVNEALSYRDNRGNAVASEAAWFEIGSSVCRGIGETLTVEAVTEIHTAGAADSIDAPARPSEGVPQPASSIRTYDLRNAAQQLLLTSGQAKTQFVAAVSETAVAAELHHQLTDWWQAGKEVFCVASARTVKKGFGKALQQTQDFEELGRELRPAAPNLHRIVNQLLHAEAKEIAEKLSADIRDALSSRSLSTVLEFGKFEEDAEEQPWQQGIDRSLSAATMAPGRALQTLQPVVVGAVQAALPAPWARRQLLEHLRPAVQEIAADCSQLQADIDSVHDLISQLEELHPTTGLLGAKTEGRATPSMPSQGASAAAGPDEAAGTCRAPTANDGSCNSSWFGQVADGSSSGSTTKGGASEFDWDSDILAGRQRLHDESRDANAMILQPVVASRLRPERMVVLNCANIGFQYNYLCSGSAATQGSCRFNWEGVRQAILFYERCGVVPQGICQHRTALYSPVPQDLQERVTVCPHVDDQNDADDLFTIRVAMRYSCQFVDNDNYRDWKHDPQRTDHDVREWLLYGDGARLKVTYVFDRFGRFIPSAHPPLPLTDSDDGAAIAHRHH